jgi:4-amino-4-deoxy-L-arabinose transferase-like glycosyltransferase
LRDLFSILAGDVAQEIKNRVQASAKDVAMLLAATLLLVCGFVVFMFAAYLFLLRYMVPVYAALIIGGFFVLAAALLVLAVKTRVAHDTPENDDASQNSGRDDLARIEAVARDYVRRNAKQSTFMSLVAGVVVGSSPEVRRTLMRGLDMALAERQARKGGDDEPRR